MATEARLERAVLSGPPPPIQALKLKLPDPSVCRHCPLDPSAVGSVKVTDPPKADDVAPLCKVRVLLLPTFLKAMALPPLTPVEPRVRDDEAGMVTPNPLLPSLILVALAAPIVIAPPELPLSRANVLVPEACSTPLIVIAPVEVLALKAVKVPPAF
jgi:hypothetical protein